MKFNYAFDIKEPLSVYKSLKGHITISHDTFQNPNELLYKIFIYTSEDKKALISQDWGKFKNPYGDQPQKQRSAPLP